MNIFSNDVIPSKWTATNNTTDRGDGEKILAIGVLGFGSILFGMLPAIISDYNRRRYPLITSMLLCFGAGILLATALVHILPEVRKQMDSNFAEITVCAGFFIIYFIDEFIHYFFGEAIQHTHPHRTNNQSYGTISSDTTRLLADAHNHYESNNQDEQQEQSGCYESRQQNLRRNSNRCINETVIAEANARICHTNHEEPCVQSMTGTLGLFVALCLHSAIEGIAIGVQNSATKVLFLLGAVASHKFVMGFCLGMEFRSNPQTSLRKHFIGILVFALGAVCGIGAGMIVVDMPSSWNSSVMPIVQGLAGGTLFYVTVCEVIPREKARWHQNTSRKAAGFGQFLAVASGFALMSVINSYLADDDS